MSVLVLLEHDRGEPSAASVQALTMARSVASALGLALEAVVCGSSGHGMAGEAAEHGASVVHIADHEHLADYGPDSWGATVAFLAGETGASAIVATGTERGNEVMANAAARLGEPMVANVTEVEPGGEVWSLTRVRWGGSLLEHAELRAGRAMVTVMPNVIEPTVDPVSSEVREFVPDLDSSVSATLVADREVLTEGMTLATAPVVVGGGRGVGSPEGFGVLEDLAEVLGGVVGCSRVATNNGWRPHSDQVGQTGTKIAPRVYFACGISGAMQHWIGAVGSKSIIAINTDPEANMVSKADYAVIGDLHEVVPAVAEEVRRRKG